VRLPLPLSGEAQMDYNLRYVYFFTFGIAIGVLLCMMFYRPDAVPQFNDEARFQLLCNATLPCPELGAAAEQRIKDEVGDGGNN
jgi:hypothetical protein